MYINIYNSEIILICSMLCIWPCICPSFTRKELNMYKMKVAEMFHHAYESYLSHAFPFDELKPISCEGVDTWGSFSLTLIDALDTLIIMKNYTEFRRVVDFLINTADFNININVSVFETNIRVVGGLISAHLLSYKAGLTLEPGWPCSGPLLHLAETVARKLLPAFQTNTGMPYGTVNLRYGVPPGETPITCTAGVSTFILEFGTLSRLTGDPVFENVARKALDALWESRSPVDLVGNHINIEEGKWTAMDAGIGGGIDSYFEYLVKGAILFQDPKLMYMFNEYYRVINKYMQRDDWYFWVSMGSGQITMPLFQSLEAFWPGLLSLVGKTEQALKSLHNYHQVWKQYGFTPEFYDVSHSTVKRDGYPLRPELIESVLYLYQATKDPLLLKMGVDILESIEHSAWTKCGYATIKNVFEHRLEDRMESFFLAETTKYLYLLFDTENFLHKNGSCGKLFTTTGGDCLLDTGSYIFNTEAHPIDVSAVYCCSSEFKKHDILLQKFQETLDLHSLLSINERKDFLRIFKQNQKKKRNLSNILDYSKKIVKTVQKGIKAIGLEKYFNIPLKWPYVHGNVYSLFGQFYNEDKGVCDKKTEYLLLGHYIPKLCLAQNFKFEKFSTTYNSNNKNKITSHIQQKNVILKKHRIASSIAEVAQEYVSSQSLQYSVSSMQNISENSYVHHNLLSSFFVNENRSINLINSTVHKDKTEVISQNSTTKFVDRFQSNMLNNSVPIFQTIPLLNIIQNLNNNLTEFFEHVIDDINYDILFCPAQPFFSRLNIMGEMFNTDL